MTKNHKSRKATFWDFGLLKGCECAMQQASSDETAKARILIVEDEEKIARFVELELLHEGYLVEKAFDGRNGLDLALNGHFDLLLLDVLLPGLNGFELLRRLRKTSSLPVIMLTAKDGIMDTVAGLDMGADDYMTKPFSIEELLARIRLVLRKSRKNSEKVELNYGPLHMDLARHRVSFQLNSASTQSGVEQEIELSSREFDLLRVFMENAELLLTRDQLLEKVWDTDFMGESNVVDVYVRYLRQKIDQVFSVKLIHTVRGLGYTLRLENQHDG